MPPDLWKLTPHVIHQQLNQRLTKQNPSRATNLSEYFGEKTKNYKGAFVQQIWAKKSKGNSLNPQTNKIIVLRPFK